MCNFTLVIDPNPKMQKMMIVLKIMFILNTAIGITRACFNFDDFFIDLISVFFLLMTNCSLYFLHAQLYIIFIIMNFVQIFCKIGGIFQLVYFDHFKDFTGKQLFLIGFYTFAMMYYVFAIFFVFLAYKEMKAIFLANRGLEYENHDDVEAGNQANVINNNNNGPANNNNNNNNNHQGYQPFSGYGVVVGE